MAVEKKRGEKKSNKKANLIQRRNNLNAYLVGKKITNRWCSSLPGIFKWESGCYFVFRMKNIEVFEYKDTSHSVHGVKVIWRKPIWTGKNIDFLRSGGRFQLHSWCLNGLVWMASVGVGKFACRHEMAAWKNMATRSRFQLCHTVIWTPGCQRQDIYGPTFLIFTPIRSACPVGGL